jgi:hypothetical protein
MSGSRLRRILAREWLILVIGFLFGILVFWSLIFYFGIRDGSLKWEWKMVGEFVGLFFTPGWQAMWCVTLLPYAVCQFVRSLIWAVKVLRSPSAPTGDS